MHTTMLLCLLWLAGSALPPALPPSAVQETAPVDRPTTFVVAVDCELARTRTWLLKDASDEQVVETAALLIKKRCAAMRVSVEVTLDAAQRRLEIALPAVPNPRQRELAESMLRSIGLCELFFLADAEWTKVYNVDIALERQKLETWRKANPTTPLELFNTLDEEQGGPTARIAWIPLDPNTPANKYRPGWAVLLPASLEEHFGVGSFERTFLAEGSYGKPAIGYEMRASRQPDFERATADLRGRRRLAVVIEGQVVSSPKLETVQAAGGVIEGSFAPAEARRLVQALQELHSPLRIVEIR